MHIQYVREYKMFLKCSNGVSYFRAYHPFPFSATMNTSPPFLSTEMPLTEDYNTLVESYSVVG
jgi:hypothetical protein